MAKTKRTIVGPIQDARKTRDGERLARRIHQTANAYREHSQSDEPPDILLGLDLATKTGYAFTFQFPGQRPILPHPSWMGQLDLSLGTYDSGSMRPLRLWRFLEELRPQLIAFEGREFSISSSWTAQQSSMKAAELSAALRTVVSIWCVTHNGVPCYGIPNNYIKKHAVEYGAADKVAMVTACNRKFGTDFHAPTAEAVGLDNVADAAFVLDMACQESAGGLIPWDLAGFGTQFLESKLKSVPDPRPPKSKRKKKRSPSAPE